MVNANIIKEKYSQGPIFIARLATCGAKVINNTILIREPKNEAQIPIPRALPGCPFFTMGKASKVVATAEGVPGIPRRAAVIRPPERPPTKTPSIVAIPTVGLMAKVKGKVKIIAIVIVNPGIAPAIIPARTPKNMLNSKLNCKICSIPKINISII
jgi:hypothetical protein